MLCQVTLEAIQKAREIIMQTAWVTPVVPSVVCSEILGQPVYLKLENLQLTGSFKIRGASYKLSRLAAQGEVKQVMAISAGNHAQGVALASRKYGIPSTVFMPADAPLAKVQATMGYGAEVHCIGKDFDETKTEAMAWLEQHPGVTFISPFDDDEIITGQGSCGLELLEQIADLNTVVVPVGGGGLISGMALALKSLKPQIRLVGVQAEASPALVQSFEKGKLTKVRGLPTIADGIAIKAPAQRTFELIQQYVDEMLVVNEEEISQALFFAIRDKHIIAEGAGVVGLAALLTGKLKAQGPTAVVLSGGNIDIKLLDSIINKGMMQIGRFLTFKTLIADSPGSLKKVLNLLEKEKANVLYIQHARFRSDIPLGATEIEIEIETRNPEHAQEILSLLEERGYQVARL